MTSNLPVPADEKALQKMASSLPAHLLGKCHEFIQKELLGLGDLFNEYPIFRFGLQKIPVYGLVIEAASQVAVQAAIKNTTEWIDKADPALKPFLDQYKEFQQHLLDYEQQAKKTQGTDPKIDDPPYASFCEMLISQRMKGQYDDRLIKAIAAAVVNGAYEQGRRSYLLGRIAELFMTLQGNDLSVLRAINDPVGVLPGIETIDDFKHVNESEGGISANRLHEWNGMPEVQGLVDFSVRALESNDLIDFDTGGPPRGLYRFTELGRELLRFIEIEGCGWQLSVR